MKGLVIASLVALATLGTAALALADSVNVCGPLREYRAATATAPGTLTVGTEQFAISSDAKANVASGATTVGTNVCLAGTWQPSQTVGRNLTDFSLTVQSTTTTAPTSSTLPSTSTSPITAPVGGLPTGIIVLAAALAVLLVGVVAKRRIDRG